MRPGGSPPPQPCPIADVECHLANPIGSGDEAGIGITEHLIETFDHAAMGVLEQQADRQSGKCINEPWRH